MSLSLTDLARRAALLFVASTLSACPDIACPDIAYIDAVTIRLDAAPAADETWELTFSPDGEPPCTLVLTADGALPVEDEPGCAPYESWGVYLVPGGIYDVQLQGSLSDDRPDEMALTLVIDGVTVIDDRFEPSYRTAYPDGAFCGDRSDGEVVVRLPER